LIKKYSEPDMGYTQWKQRNFVISSVKNNI